MVGNLVGELAKRKININSVADHLGIHRNSVHNKLYGASEFTVSEAFKIYDAYFADSGLDLRELFEITM